jgi:hypothetical protein
MICGGSPSISVNPPLSDGVEIGLVHFVGIEFGRERVAHVEPALALCGEVRNEVGDVVKAFLARLVHVAVDRRLVVMLLDELDHRVAEIAEGIGNVGLDRGAAISELFAAVAAGAMKKGPAPNALAHFSAAASMLST